MKCVYVRKFFILQDEVESRLPLHLQVIIIISVVPAKVVAGFFWFTMPKRRRRLTTSRTTTTATKDAGDVDENGKREDESVESAFTHSFFFNGILGYGSFISVLASPLFLVQLYYYAFYYCCYYYTVPRCCCFCCCCVSPLFTHRSFHYFFIPFLLVYVFACNFVSLVPFYIIIPLYFLFSFLCVSGTSCWFFGWCKQSQKKKSCTNSTATTTTTLPPLTPSIRRVLFLSKSFFSSMLFTNIQSLSAQGIYTCIHTLKTQKNSVNKQGSIHPNSAILLLFKPLSQWSFNYVATLFVVNVMANLREKEIHATVESLEWWR